MRVQTGRQTPPVLQSVRKSFPLNRILPVLLALAVLPLSAQRGTGELRLTVKDPAGLDVEATGSLVGQSAQVRRTFATDPQGRFSLRSLPFGVYRVQVEHPGFAPFSSLVEVRTEAPLDYRVTLGLT